MILCGARNEIPYRARVVLEIFFLGISVCQYVSFPKLVISPAGAVAKYCDEHVCLSIREHISGVTHAIFTNFSVHVAYGHGSVLLWQGDEIPREWAVLGVFFPTDNAL